MLEFSENVELQSTRWLIGRQEALQQHCKTPQVPPVLNDRKIQTHN